MVTVLTRLLWRDIWRTRSQVAAAVLVVGCGVATLVAMRNTSLALSSAQQAYYASYRFADLFVHLKRAPIPTVARVRALPGVAHVDARVVSDVTLDVPGLTEPATGHVVSIPEVGWPTLNLLHLQSGRYVAPGRDDEVMIGASFAEANGLKPGDRLGAVLNGRWKTLKVVGVAISPEFIYEAGAGSIFPDYRHYGVLWMGEDALSAALNMDSAFNDLALTVDGRVPVSEIVAAVDRLLAPYGGLGTLTRDEQVSHRFVSDEIAQNRITATYVPAIFFCVAMFLMQNVLSRLIEMRRMQVGLMKAFGYGDARIGLHYLELACVIAAAGAVLGIAGGSLLGEYLTSMYAHYYRFAHLEYRTQLAVVLGAFVASFGTAVAGALGSVRKAMRLMPVEALHPASPPIFSAGWAERIGLYRRLGVAWRMIARNLARQPAKAAFACLGLASASAILVVGGYFFDAIDELFDLQFQRIERQDVTLTFTQPLSHRAVHALAHLPGVLAVEPFRSVPVRLSSGYRSQRVSLDGVGQQASLRRLVDERSQPFAVPPQGLLLTNRLATLLGVRPGDRVTVEVLEGKRQVRRVTVAQTVGERVGIGAYMDERALTRLLGEGGNWSGARLAVDSSAIGRLYATLKRTPAVSAVAVRRAVIDSFRKIMDESVRLSTSINFAFACVIAFGVAFNGMRIAYSERAQQLASLRVLGFTRIEVAWILLGEQWVLAALSFPIGLALGYGVCAWLSERLATDLYRLPLVIRTSTLAYAVLVTSFSVACSGLVVALKIRRFDIVDVLKSRES